MDVDEQAGNTIDHLTGLLQATRLIGSERCLDSLLDSLAGILARSLGYGAVVVNLYRPQFDDLLVTAAYGDDQAREMLMGRSYPLSAFAPLMQERFDLGGVYYVPHDAVDWDSLDLDFYVPSAEAGDGPDAWHPEDSIMVPMVGAGGDLIGILSVDEPLSGRRPSGRHVDLMVAFARHATAVVEAAQRRLADERLRCALHQLLAVSAQITGSVSTDEVLRSVCEAIGTALGFRKVVLLLHDGTEHLRLAASHGWTESSDLVFERAHVAALLEPRFEVEGCYLLTREQGLERWPDRDQLYPSRFNGRGPRAWIDHWLIVPLRTQEDPLHGVVWVDEPEDLLLPSAQQLQALRVFADQATMALMSAARTEELWRSHTTLSHRASHDPLTGLGNRTLLSERLGASLADDRRQPVSLLYIDLDGMKEINDTLGHDAGDQALADTAARLVASVRPEDSVIRLGGDEFVVVLPGCGEAGARAAADRILAALERPFVVAGAEVCLGASIGAVTSTPGADEHELLRRADALMYSVKRSGGNGCAHATLAPPL